MGKIKTWLTEPHVPPVRPRWKAILAAFISSGLETVS